MQRVKSAMAGGCPDAPSTLELSSGTLGSRAGKNKPGLAIGWSWMGRLKTPGGRRSSSASRFWLGDHRFQLLQHRVYQPQLVRLPDGNQELCVFVKTQLAR